MKECNIGVNFDKSLLSFYLNLYPKNPNCRFSYKIFLNLMTLNWVLIYSVIHSTSTLALLILNIKWNYTTFKLTHLLHLTEQVEWKYLNFWIWRNIQKWETLNFKSFLYPLTWNISSQNILEPAWKTPILKT